MADICLNFQHCSFQFRISLLDYFLPVKDPFIQKSNFLFKFYLTTSILRCKPPTLDWVKYYLWRSLGDRASPYIVNHEQEYYHGTIYIIHLG